MARDEKKPAIRFAGFTDPWEQRKLCELGDVITGNTPPTANSECYDGSFSFVSPADIQSNRFIDNTITTLTKKGFELGRKISKRSSLFVSIGSTIGKVAQANRDLVTNQQINSVVPYSENDRDFVFTLLEANSPLIRKLSATQAVPIVNKTTFSEHKMLVPIIEEQEQIGTFFKQLDNHITLHLRKCDKLISVKKSMLEKMFPQNGSNVPEIRFAGFTDPWEQRKLGELSEPLMYGLNAASSEFDGINKYIRITDIDDESRMFKMDGLTSPVFQPSQSDKYKLEEGDLLFARTGASVGKTYIYKEFDGLVYFAGFLIRARINPDYAANFIFQNTLTDRYKRFIQITSQRSGQPGVNAQEYESFSFFVPKREEQELIGIFFNQMDNLITLHQRKLEKLKNIKKSLLEKMFV